MVFFLSLFFFLSFFLSFFRFFFLSFFVFFSDRPTATILLLYIIFWFKLNAKSARAYKAAHYFKFSQATKASMVYKRTDWMFCLDHNRHSFRSNNQNPLLSYTSWCDIMFILSVKSPQANRWDQKKKMKNTEIRKWDWNVHCSMKGIHILGRHGQKPKFFMKMNYGRKTVGDW